MSKKTYDVAELHVELAGITPAISRRVRVPLQVNLSQLHDILQCVFGWEEAHLHSFHIGEQEYRDADQMFDDFAEDETGLRLADIVEQGADEFSYVYDFGDDWEHIVRIDRTATLTDPAERLVLLGGENAAPPEDCGGPYGYAHLLEVLSDPESEDHDELSEWVVDDFDPTAFPRQNIANRLDKLAGMLVAANR